MSLELLATSVPPSEATEGDEVTVMLSSRQYFQSHLQSPLPGLIQFQELIYLLYFILFFWLKLV